MSRAEPIEGHARDHEAQGAGALAAHICRQEQALSDEMASVYAQVYHTRYHEALRSLISDQGKRLCRESSAPRILDLGCGPASLAPHLRARMPSAEIVGVDVSWEMLALGRSTYPGVTMCNGVIEQLPFRTESFDLVVGFSVLHHLADLSRVWPEIVRVLRPGGGVVFGEPQETRFDRWCWLVKLTKLILGPLYLPLWFKNHGRPRPEVEQRLQKLVTPVHRALTLQEIQVTAQGLPLTMHCEPAAVISPLFLPMFFDDDQLERVVFQLVWLGDRVFARWCRPLATEVLIYGWRH